METNPIQPGVAAQEAAAARTTAESDADAAASAAAAEKSGDVFADFTTFLTLLTEQLKSQDPLKPLDSTEFVSQLASFSAVEQQVATNDKLDLLISAVSGGDNAQMADWLGRSVMAPGLPGKFDRSGPVEFEAPIDPEAFAAKARVFNEAGDIVAEFEHDPESTTGAWDGSLDVGGTAPAGFYDIQIAFMNEDLYSYAAAPVSTYAQVTEVRTGADGPILMLGNGAKLSPADVTAIR